MRPKAKDSAGVSVKSNKVLLSEAANSGDLESLKSILSTLPEDEVKKCVNTPDEQGITPLILAVKKGSLESVKLLLYHGADINYIARLKLHNWKVWQFAKKEELKWYLKKCSYDLEKMGTTRAQLELSVEKIATNPHSSFTDHEYFDVCLHKLIEHCEYNLNAPGEGMQPLLIKAARADNIPIVLKLMKDFQVNEITHDFETAETIMHIACNNKSKLRFYLVKHFPHLLRKPDCDGNLPLHVACKKNDIQFVSWLFQDCLADAEMQKDVTDYLMKKTRSHSDHSVMVGSIPSRYSFHYDSSKQSLLKFHSTPEDEHFSQVVETSESLENDASALRPIFHICNNDDDDDLDSIPIESLEPVSSNEESEHKNSLSGPPMPPAEPEIDTLLDFENLISLSPLTISNIVNMKPFSVAVNGDSVFHLAARHHYFEILTIIVKAAHFLKHLVNLSVLSCHHGFASLLPIEEMKNPGCIQMLIDLSMAAGQMPLLLQDARILCSAVATGDIRVVQTFIANGFHKGLKPAIHIAIISEFDDILRLLLYWQTQVVNSLEIARIKTVRGQKLMNLDDGVIKWEEMQVKSIRQEWLTDSSSAVNMVSRNLRFSGISTDITEHDFKFFKKLGTDCLQFFDNLGIVMKIKEIPLAPITEVTISDTESTFLPCELFQMASVRKLKLSHNKLRALPSSSDLSENIYTSKLVKLNLDGNMLTELPEQMFRGLSSSLEELNAQHNQLKDLPPGLWAMPKLKILRLSHNQLKSLHYLSDPSFFNDARLSEIVTSSFTTNDKGHLICVSSDPDSAEMQSIFTYLTRLALFHQTVSTVLQKSAVTDVRSIYREIIAIHQKRSMNHTRKKSVRKPQPSRTRVLNIVEDETKLLTADLIIVDLSYNMFLEMPWDLACISPNLKRLDLRANTIPQLDIIHSIPRNLNSLILENDKIEDLSHKRSLRLPCGNPLHLLSARTDTIADKYCKHCNHQILKNLSILSLEDNHLTSFPVIAGPSCTESSYQINDSDPDSHFEVVNQDPYYPQLSVLTLAHNRLQQVPDHIHCLPQLTSLKLSYNDIIELPLEMGLVNSGLLILELNGMCIRNVPESLLDQHTPKQLLKHLKALKQNSRPYRRMKLMVVGEPNMGKTSLLLNLVKKGRVKRFVGKEMSSIDCQLTSSGVELGDWEYSQRGKSKITFMTWDFGGQEYSTHQCFLTRRSLYLLLWNVTHGEEGLKSLKPWLEQIEGRAPKSPVIVIATHLDLLPQSKRSKIMSDLQDKFWKMYIVNSHREYTYPSICEKVQFISLNPKKKMNIDALRDYIYEFALQYKVQGLFSCAKEPLLDEPVPEYYLLLQDFVQEVAQQRMNHRLQPILTKKEFLLAIQNSDLVNWIKEADIDQAVSFLHDSGILLHFKDNSHLSDLYFINPQWLCMMLTKLMEENPYHRQGLMLIQDVKNIYPEYFNEFIEVLKKFDVVFCLDERRLLIPSLLPVGEEDSCLVFTKSISKTLCNTEIFDSFCGKSQQDQAPMYLTPHPILTRYYLLPFIPNSFFTRLMARLMSSEILYHMNQSLKMGSWAAEHIINSAHWKCWRNGIVIKWSHMTIFRIAPIDSNSFVGMEKVAIVTGRDKFEHVDEMKGLEIKIAIFPEEYFPKSSTLSTLECQLSTSLQDNHEYSSGKCLATWLLYQATTHIDSVFEDWYESFARRKGFDSEQHNVRITNPCNKCAEHIQDTLNKKSHHDALSEEKVCYIFTGPYAVLVSTSDAGKGLVCPKHGQLKIADVAPDLVFCDFLPRTVFTDPSLLTFRYKLGDGGFGTVFRATLHIGGTVQTIAAKKFTPDMDFMNKDKDIVTQLKAWDVYQKASTEARVMHQLSHKNVLGLIGIVLKPLSLLVELAPEGDLKRCIQKRFKKENMRLERRTLQSTLIQVAEALDYLHSRQFIYRDLKPANVLVWKFPWPETQQCPNASVHVKVADYGISKKISPMGICGIQGTTPYLPPEVILYGGREPYSTKVDVYAFGMFIYYLTSFRAPFDDNGNPISAILGEGKRPELSLKEPPQSLHMFELMCWCWSERPTQRPDFPTILRILKEDDFTQLLASVPLTDSKRLITASCVQLSSSINFHPSNIVCSPVVDNSTSVGNEVDANSPTGDDSGEFSAQIWYGTEVGGLGVIQFQNDRIIHKTFEQQRNNYVSVIKLISGRIWLATVGAGLLIYDADNHETTCIGQWGLRERHQIYSLMEIESSKRVLVLTDGGMLVFSSDISLTDNSQGLGPKSGNITNVSSTDNVEGLTPIKECENTSNVSSTGNVEGLTPIKECENTSNVSSTGNEEGLTPIKKCNKRENISNVSSADDNEVLTPSKECGVFSSTDGIKDLIPIIECEKTVTVMSIGVVVPRVGSNTKSEVWLTSLYETAMTILNTSYFSIEKRVPFKRSKIESTRELRHMVTLEVANKPLVAVANMHLIRLFDVEERECMASTFDCHEALTSKFDISIKCTSGRVTALSAKDHFLYAATGGGAILHLNCRTMEPVHIFDPYHHPIHSLLLIDFSGVQSKFHQLLSIGSRSSLYGGSRRPSRSESVRSSTSKSSVSYETQDDTGHSVLISFGGGYKGVARDCQDCPEDFLLPSERNKTNTQPSRSDKDMVNLLLWSIDEVEEDSKLAMELAQTDETDVFV